MSSLRGAPHTGFTYKYNYKERAALLTMIHNQQISATERWVGIDEFPGYSVSDRGRVLNDRTGLLITPTRKPQGLRMVGLMRDRDQYKRSLTLLVAQAFLLPPPNEVFTTPINLDGDRGNNHYTNLTWRPLWFARKYMLQFSDGHATYEGPVEDIETGEVYKNSMHASIVNGVLDAEIVLAMHNNTYVWPTGQVFRKAIDR